MIRLICFFALIYSCLSASERGINIGTVLFAPSDAHKDCWTSEQLALLTSRMVVEAILPSRNSLNVNDNDMISDIVEYFRMILEVVRKNTSGKIKHLMLLAVTDALGGYMTHFFLPLAKYSYYAGNVDYNSVIKVHQLYDELKTYLRTNGAGWSKPPKDIGKRVCAQPINLKDRKIASNNDPCAGLIFQEVVASGHTAQSGSIEIPMPYFDSKSHPSAIAVPFKAYSLRNVEARSSAYILVKYYIAASKCLGCKDTNNTAASTTSISDFNSKLFGFITQKVLPHLCDEKFYAAFGGVLRILETMKQSGFVKNLNVIGSYNIMPEVEDKESMAESSNSGNEEDDEKSQLEGIPVNSEKSSGNENRNAGDVSGGQSQRSDEGGTPVESKTKKNRSNLILLAALATIIIWFFLGACFVCCRIRSARIKKDEQMKLIEGGGGGGPSSKASTSVRSKCMSGTGSTKTKCSTASGKAATCTKQSCGHYVAASSTTSGHPSQGSHRASSSSSKSSSKHTTPKSGGSSNVTSASTTAESKTSEESESPRSQVPTQVQTMHYYPASFACHSSIAGKYKVGSSSEEFSSKSTIKKPFVFGYDFQTTSEESSPRDHSDQEGETEMGNLSK
nr:uncharacterized protein LOC111418708 [Onthophagus taurus]